MSRTQYRIRVNGAESITDAYPGERWSAIAARAEFRGGIEAVFERRTIFQDDTILAMLSDASGWISLPDGRVVQPWEVMAEVHREA